MIRRHPTQSINNQQASQICFDALSQFNQHQISRRQFLQGMLAGLAAFQLPAGVQAQSSDNSAASAADSKTDDWQTLAEVLEHLFPADADSPGAYDINAMAYIRDFLMHDPLYDESDKTFIMKGIGWLDGMSKQLHQSQFILLDTEKREAVLQRIVQSRAGENWLSTLLSCIFEALLTDPVYGGNQDKKGWQWLAHDPGFPRPTAILHGISQREDVAFSLSK